MPSTPNNFISALATLPPALLRVGCFVALALMHSAQAQNTATPADQQALLAAFAYNFCLFTDWPATQSGKGSQDFVLAVAGQPMPALAALGKRKVARRRIQIVELGETDAVPPSCDALICNALSPARQADILAQVGERPILTLSPNAGFCRDGGIVEFFVRGERMRFRVSLQNLNRAKLHISSQLLRLAEILPAQAEGN